VLGRDMARDLARRRQGQRRTRGRIVLYYHAVTAAQRARFAAQMDLLRRRATPFEAGSRERISDDGWRVAVTFDDGFLSVVEHAVPELEARNIPFTVFVPSGCLGERPSWVRDPNHPSWQERVMSAAELRALAGLPLATIGSHSVTHRNMRQLDSAQAADELVRSRLELQAAAGTDIDLFSFPHGAYNAALLAQARQAGYRRVFTIQPAPMPSDPDAFSVGRVAADPDDWPIEFRLKLAGAYRWRSRWRRRPRTP